LELRRLQQGGSADRIVEARRREPDDQEAPIHIHEGVAFQAGEFLVRVVVARRRRFGRLHRLRIDDGGGRLSFAPRLQPIKRDEDCVQALEQRGAGEAAEPIVDRLPRRKIQGKRPPRHAVA
jgi:hypothetical protein